MFTSKRLIQKYQKTHERKFGKKITEKEAERELSDLTKLIKLITKERKNRHGK